MNSDSDEPGEVVAVLSGCFTLILVAPMVLWAGYYVLYAICYILFVDVRDRSGTTSSWVPGFWPDSGGFFSHLWWATACLGVMAGLVEGTRAVVRLSPWNSTSRLEFRIRAGRCLSSFAFSALFLVALALRLTFDVSLYYVPALVASVVFLLATKFGTFEDRGVDAEVQDKVEANLDDFLEKRV
ncbi:MAG: hypothetical protein FJ276_21855 [Planctomycetes bacterium]|nr:hypothetical protein [Planctomycetota bacterium]